jgi:hypothetical protein
VHSGASGLPTVVPTGFEPVPSGFQADVLPVTPENHLEHLRQEYQWDEHQRNQLDWTDKPEVKGGGAQPSRIGRAALKCPLAMLRVSVTVGMAGFEPALLLDPNQAGWPSCPTPRSCWL